MSSEHSHSNQAYNEDDSEIVAITGGLDNLPRMVATADITEDYILTRSESGMSNYSDLVDDILSEYKLDEEQENIGHEYNKLKIRSYAQETNKYKAIGSPVDNKLKDDSLNSRTHLFRGKNLNTTVIDQDTGAQRPRTKDEKQHYVTKRFTGQPVHSDGVSTIKDDADKRKVVKEKVAKYFRNILAGNENTKLFNSGVAYSAAVSALMDLVGTRGNPVTATSKLPWVACEYAVGQMGGASGGDRGIPSGYDKNRKPVNRILANNFIISMTIVEYLALRVANDLIDVNVDVAKGTDVNRVIEEVTFNSEIPGELVIGSLPMVLPRFDRKYDEMSQEKRDQYKRVFGLDKRKYEELHSGVKTTGVKIGEITNHLILHYGTLLRRIAVSSDRRNGYTDKFVVPYNTQYCGYVDDLTTPKGTKLDSRAARQNSKNKTDSLIAQDEPESPVRNLDAEFQSSTLEQAQQQQAIKSREEVKCDDNEVGMRK